MLISYGGFAGALGTLAARMPISTLLGDVTIAGVRYAEEHKARTAIPDRLTR